MTLKRLLIALIAAAGLAAVPVAMAGASTATLPAKCDDVQYRLHAGDADWNPALDADHDGTACEGKPERPKPTTTTSSTTAPPEGTKTMVVCIQGVTTTVPEGAKTVTGQEYAKGPCPDDDKRVICLNGTKTIEVTKENEDTVGEPYTLGPCPTKPADPVRTNPRFTG